MQFEVFKCIQHVPDRDSRAACPHVGAKEVLLPEMLYNSVCWYKQVGSQILCS